MEPQNKPHTAIDSESTAVSTPHKSSVLDSSPPPSKQNSGEHISLSPPAGNSPDRSSVSSDRTTLTHGSSPREYKAIAPPPEAESPPKNSPENHPPVVNWSFVGEPMAVVAKSDPGSPDGKPVEETSGGGGPVGASGRRRPSLSILSRAKREKMVKKAALGFRIFGFLFCLVSFSVMAADRNQGWALDSFERYKEFRYCMSMNVIGFVYSGAQAMDLSYKLATGKYIIQHQQQRRYYFDFAIDQLITYLLISASSSAMTRIDDWQSNWGKDKFTTMASASVSMSFLAFVALAANSLLSGYALCTSKSM